MIEVIICLTLIILVLIGVCLYLWLRPTTAVTPVLLAGSSIDDDELVTVTVTPKPVDEIAELFWVSSSSGQWSLWDFTQDIPLYRTPSILTALKDSELSTGAKAEAKWDWTETKHYMFWGPTGYEIGYLYNTDGVRYYQSYTSQRAWQVDPAEGAVNGGWGELDQEIPWSDDQTVCTTSNIGWANQLDEGTLMAIPMIEPVAGTYYGFMQGKDDAAHSNTSLGTVVASSLQIEIYQLEDDSIHAALLERDVATNEVVWSINGVFTTLSMLAGLFTYRTVDLDGNTNDYHLICHEDVVWLGRYVHIPYVPPSHTPEGGDVPIHSFRFGMATRFTN